jgi:hypothetical protein
VLHETLASRRDGGHRDAPGRSARRTRDDATARREGSDAHAFGRFVAAAQATLSDVGVERACPPARTPRELREVGLGYGAHHAINRE